MCIKDIVANAIAGIGGAITRFVEKLAIADGGDQVAIFNRRCDGAELDDGFNGGAEEGRAMAKFAFAKTI